MISLRLRRRKPVRAGSASMTAQAGVWAGWGEASEDAAAGRLALSAYRHLSASRMEEEFLWGQTGRADAMGVLAHDLADVSLGIDMDLLATPNAVLWRHIEQARVRGNEEREWQTRLAASA